MGLVSQHSLFHLLTISPYEAGCCTTSPLEEEEDFTTKLSATDAVTLTESSESWTECPGEISLVMSPVFMGKLFVEQRFTTSL